MLASKEKKRFLLDVRHDKDGAKFTQTRHVEIGQTVQDCSEQVGRSSKGIHHFGVFNNFFDVTKALVSK